MTDLPTTTRDMRRVMLVNMLTLPLTTVLVILGFGVAQPVGTVRTVSLVLLLASIGFNLLSLHLIRRGVGRPLRLSRIYLNLAINVALVYLLGAYFPPMWLILALSPVSSAIYGTRRQTLVSFSQSATALVAIPMIHGIHSPLGVGEVIAQVLFVGVISFLINESIRTGEPAMGPR